VRRAVSVLRAFTVSQPELGLSEVARVAGLNKTTAFRLLSALEGEGLVQRSPEGEAYRLGPELAALGLRAVRATDLLLAARPELPALAEATQETASLEVLVGREVVILDEVRGRRVLAAVPEVGAHSPAHATSTGKAQIAFQPEEQWEEFLAPPLPRLTAKTLCDPGELRKELRRVRARGYATTIEELERGYVGVGVPVRGVDGSAVATLSIGGPSTRLTAARVSEIAQLLSAAALRASRRLGFREDGAGPGALPRPSRSPRQGRSRRGPA
jgi:DNA-binding IclR family transcriptional regulator